MVLDVLALPRSDVDRADFLRTSSVCVWGGALPDVFLLFSFPCSVDHERDWPPYKVVFIGLAANTLNVRNNNNNNPIEIC